MAQPVALSSPAPPQPPVVAPARVPTRDWHDEIIYMVMTDRFHNGDKTNDAGCDPTDHHRFHGGDWQGIIDKLDYLQGVGATTLWISPVHEQKRDFFGMDGYHGYWATDFYRTEPSFGSLEKLKELVDKAHQRGMKVIVDFAINHTGYDAPIAMDPQFKEWFHHYGNQMTTTRWSFEKQKMCGLPDFAHENPDCARWLIDMCKWWIDQTGIDGMRLDAARHIPMKFWKQFSQEIHAHAGSDFLLVGEIYHQKPSIVAPYQNEGGLDSVFDFPLNAMLRNTIGRDHRVGRWESIKLFARNCMRHPGESFRVLMGHGKSDMRNIAKVIEKDSMYRRADMLVTMLDNHDMVRFITAAGEHGEDKLKLALDCIMTMRGIPCVYYGTEVALPGSWDDNRAPMQFGVNPQMLQHFTSLTSMRRDSIALRRGTIDNLMADQTVVSYARRHPQQTYVITLNSSDVAETRDIPVKLPANTVLHNVRNGDRYVVDGDTIQVTLPPRSSVILSTDAAAVPHV